jgi:hypothetical protein
MNLIWAGMRARLIKEFINQEKGKESYILGYKMQPLKVKPSERSNCWKPKGKVWFQKNNDNQKFHGVIFNEWDKSMSRTGPVEAEFKPTTETAGLAGTCKWCKSKEEQNEMIEYGKKIGYKEE